MPAAGSKRCFYDTLGVSKDSDDKALKKAYRKLAIKWHPDKHVSESEAAQKRAEEQFKAVAEAYDVLSDTKKRQVYDQLGHAGLEGGMPEGGMGGGMGGFGFPGGGGGGSTFVFRSAGGGQGGGGVDPMQMFAQMFGDGMMGGMRADDRMGGAFGSSPFTSLFGSMGGGTGMGPASMGMGMGMGGGMGAGKRRRSAAGGGGDDDDGCGCLLRSGCAVRVRGLRNAPQHNGRTGVVERHDPAQNRYIVRLDGNGRPGSGSWSAGGGGGGGGAERLACRREHLLQMMRVQIAHLSSRPELNGRAVRRPLHPFRQPFRLRFTYVTSVLVKKY
eukprot:COSAG01_NODE_3364_length_6193_cov_5.789465_5_plen_329_part_00